MPIEEVTLQDGLVNDLGPLLQCRTLKWIVLPRGVREIEPLRPPPALTELSYDEAVGKGGPPSMTAAEFWKEYDAKK